MVNLHMCPYVYVLNVKFHTSRMKSFAHNRANLQTIYTQVERGNAERSP